MKIARIVVLLSVVVLATAASLTQAASTGRQALTTSHLRVCADPSNLPFSNKAGEGFENRIVELIGKELGREVLYTWFPQTTGFIRNTLKLRQCDLVSGITTTSETVQNTNPYYHSAYSIVYRKSLGEPLVTITDPRLKSLRLGIVAGTPPGDILAGQGLMGNIKPYHLLADTRRNAPARQAVLDVASGETDVAFIWGPIAGYFASQSEEPLVVTPLLNEDRRVRMNYRVSMAVRYNETDWKHEINEVLAKLQPQIDEILKEYGVPLLNDLGELRDSNP
ncbi:substrate-binding domain-containing protein [Granulosicoccus antarcticus]|uniref:substrate-binding domain-containing protein n=1 Tax=Granulosicoccus antarcticus TaxID=437505 RepID=UPI0012FDF4F3|nr:substrate-binding domain-containing protein [Granulosicoccus antarcticus]